MLISEILKSFILEQDNEFHRFNSWKHCYDFFQKIYFNNKSDDDLAALNLGFYLASWGMYRGSTFLLQNDYKIHIKVVQLLKKNFQKDDYTFDYIENIERKIVEIYEKSAHVNSSGNSIPSSTLVTKILLGTYGCIPAYDRYFLYGYKIVQKNNCNFTNKSFQELNLFYENNKIEFEEFASTYPKMKLLDMFFWKIGFNQAEKDKLKQKLLK